MTAETATRAGGGNDAIGNLLDGEKVAIRYGKIGQDGVEVPRTAAPRLEGNVLRGVAAAIEVDGEAVALPDGTTRVDAGGAIGKSFSELARWTSMPRPRFTKSREAWNPCASIRNGRSRCSKKWRSFRPARRATFERGTREKPRGAPVLPRASKSLKWLRTLMTPERIAALSADFVEPVTVTITAR
jgi:hypothetical protein